MKRLVQAGILVALLLALLPAAAQQRAKRLILKDGSYQPVVRWEIKGERVRYYSAERFEWEELPKSLVDWTATDKYNQDIEAGAAAERQKLSAEEQAERKAQEARTPLVAPGVRLPDNEGVYLLDQYKGRPELVEIVQNGGELNKNMSKNILRAAINPLASSKQTIEVKGARARIQAHEGAPVLYINVAKEENTADSVRVDSDKDDNKKDLDQLPDRFRIARAEKKKDARVVGNLKIAFYGKVTQNGNWVPAKTEPVSSDWVKLTPATPLAPGEYVVIEMLGPKQMNLYVWDFGVDPNAPENPGTWTPTQTKENKTGTEESPVLQDRPK